MKLLGRSSPGLGYGLVGRFVNALMLAAWLTAAPAAAAEPVRILALGDSLTAGYGLSLEQAFPARLQAALKESNIDATVINSGVSGDTSAGGLARLDWVLSSAEQKGPVDAAIVELGANDALRGLDPAATEANLDKILTRLQARHIRVLLAGMMAPPNRGREYTGEFDGIYPKLAKKHGVALYPFFLDGVALDAKLKQGDAMHPNAAGVEVIVKRILPYVKDVIRGR